MPAAACHRLSVIGRHVSTCPRPRGMIPVRDARWRAVVLSALLAILLPFSPGTAVGAEKPPEDAAAGETLRFRRVFGPADRLKDWLPGQVKYVPIEPAEFERLLTLIGSRASASAAPAAAHVATAEYSAQLAGDHLVAGQASLESDPCGQDARAAAAGTMFLGRGQGELGGAQAAGGRAGAGCRGPAGRARRAVGPTASRMVARRAARVARGARVLRRHSGVPGQSLHARRPRSVGGALRPRPGAGIGMGRRGRAAVADRIGRLRAVPAADRAGPRGADFAAVAVVAERDAGLRRFRARRRRLGTTGV